MVNCVSLVWVSKVISYIIIFPSNHECSISSPGQRLVSIWNTFRLFFSFPGWTPNSTEISQFKRFFRSFRRTKSQLSSRASALSFSFSFSHTHFFSLFLAHFFSLSVALLPYIVIIIIWQSVKLFIYILLLHDIVVVVELVPLIFVCSIFHLFSLTGLKLGTLRDNGQISGLLWSELTKQTSEYDIL